MQAAACSQEPAPQVIQTSIAPLKPVERCQPTRPGNPAQARWCQTCKKTMALFYTCSADLKWGTSENNGRGRCFRWMTSSSSVSEHIQHIHNTATNVFLWSGDVDREKSGWSPCPSPWPHQLRGLNISPRQHPCSQASAQALWLGGIY